MNGDNSHNVKIFRMKKPIQKACGNIQMTHFDNLMMQTSNKCCVIAMFIMKM